MAYDMAVTTVPTSMNFPNAPIQMPSTMFWNTIMSGRCSMYAPYDWPAIHLHTEFVMLAFCLKSQSSPKLMDTHMNDSYIPNHRHTKASHGPPSRI